MDRYTVTQPASRVTVQVTFRAVEEQPDDTAMPFTDVAAGQWYAEAVQYVYEKGLMTGTSATAFAPDATTTRGMIVTMLYRLEGGACCGSFRLCRCGSGPMVRQCGELGCGEPDRQRVWGNLRPQ